MFATCVQPEDKVKPARAQKKVDGRGSWQIPSWQVWAFSQQKRPTFYFSAAPSAAGPSVYLILGRTEAPMGSSHVTNGSLSSAKPGNKVQR